MVGGKLNHENLEKNIEVKVKLGGKELSLVDAIKELEQQNELSEPQEIEEGPTIGLFGIPNPLYRKPINDSREKATQ